MDHGKNKKRGGSASAASLTLEAITDPHTGLPAEMVKGADGRWRPASTPAAALERKSREGVINEVFGLAREALLDPSQQDRLVKSAEGIADLFRVCLTVTPGLASSGHVPNYKSKLLPAVDVIQQGLPMIRELAPAAVADVAIEHLQSASARVETLGRIAEAFGDVATDLDSAQTYPEQWLATTARTVLTRVGPLLPQSAPLMRLLRPLDDFVNGSSEKGAETRKAIDKAVAEAEDRTLAWVSKNQAAAAPAAPATSPAAPAPATPTSADPTSLRPPRKAGRTRGRDS